MSRPQRIAQYIQNLAYQSLVAHEEREDRPDDAPSAPERVSDYTAWKAESYLGYVPFRAPPANR